MAKKNDGESYVSTRPALTPEAQENKMIALAINLAEKQLREGTASSQVISYYLKLASSREKYEQEYLKAKTECEMAKVEAIKVAERTEQMYAEAIAAMQQYSGHDDYE